MMSYVIIMQKHIRMLGIKEEVKRKFLVSFLIHLNNIIQYLLVMKNFWIKKLQKKILLVITAVFHAVSMMTDTSNT